MDGLQAGPTAEEIAASEASVRAAQASVWSASGSVTAAEDVSEADIAAAQKALDAALDDQQAAHDAWVDLAICKVNVEGTIARTSFHSSLTGLTAATPPASAIAKARDSGRRFR